MLFEECAKRWQHNLDPRLDHQRWTPKEVSLEDMVPQSLGANLRVDYRMSFFWSQSVATVGNGGRSKKSIIVRGQRMT